MANGDSLETFTIHGFGYGLLSADLVEPFLLQYYGLSAHAYTRGTWIAPESASVDRDSEAPSFCAPAGLAAPLNMKYMLLYEEPMTHTLWVGKALPRVWLDEGQRIAVGNATTAYGRVSFVYTSHITSSSTVDVRVVWPAGSGRVPQGGLRVRVRAPTRGVGRLRLIKKAMVAGKRWVSAPQQLFWVAAVGVVFRAILCCCGGARVSSYVQGTFPGSSVDTPPTFFTQILERATHTAGVHV